MRHEPSIRPAARVVSATYFVRNFAELKREADRAPIHIESHGKTGWALVSNDYLAEHGATGGASDSFDVKTALLDLVTAMVVLVDRGDTVRWVNAAMRRLAPSIPMVGQKISELTSAINSDFLAGAVRRVFDTGQVESFELDSRLHPGRTYRVIVVRLGEDAALIAEDVTEQVAARRQEASCGGLQQALDALDGIARGTLTLRGAIDLAPPGLAEMTGMPATALVGTRLASLFDVASRVAVGDAIERAMLAREPARVSAGLLVAGAAVRAVDLAIAPVEDRDHVAGATFIIARA